MERGTRSPLQPGLLPLTLSQAHEVPWRPWTLWLASSSPSRGPSTKAAPSTYMFFPPNIHVSLSPPSSIGSNVTFPTTPLLTSTSHLKSQLLMLSERSQTHNLIYYIIPFARNFPNRKIHRNRTHTGECRSCEEGEGGWPLNGYRIVLRMMNMFWNPVMTHCCLYNTAKIMPPKWYTLKWLILCSGNFTTIKKLATSPIIVLFTQIHSSPQNVPNTQWDSCVDFVYCTYPLSWR